MIDSLLQKLAKKSQKEPEKLVAKKPDEDFIPYVCHFDPNTILTKNGELLQIIRIKGFGNETVMAELISLRDSVRDAVIGNIKDNKVALWFNTIRRKKNITPKGEFSDAFSKAVSDFWIDKNKWNDQYVNELYITVIVEGIDTSIVNINGFVRSFSYITTKALHKNFLDAAHNKLKKITEGILKDTKEYGATLLGVAEWEGVLYSEPMRFFGKLVNLYEERYPLAANDISNDLASHKVAFANRELEVVGYNNKNYGAMLSLKEYFEVSPAALDRILQLPLEFIITQSFDFAFTKKELEPYAYQDYVLQVSGDQDFRHASGINDFLESGAKSSTDYGKLQTTIMFISSSRENLEKDVKSALDQFSSLGFVVIREDIFSEACFWSQLPGNFRYLCRQKLINTNRIAGFAALHSFPAGLIAGNHWGPAVTVFKTVLNTPYFFNFHSHDLGHTLIIGPEASGKTVLLNFLLTQSRKFNNKLFYFDINNSSKCLIRALSGHHYQLAHDHLEMPDFLHLNPLSLPKNSANQNFFTNFFASLVAFSKDPVPENEMNMIPQVVERMMVSDISNFAAAAESFNTPETANIYERLKVWNGGKLGYIFGSTGEINWNDQIMAFELSEIFEQKPVLIPVVNYILHRIEMVLDGNPSIIVVNAARDVIDNPIIGPDIAGFLERAKQKNCVVIFIDEDTIGITEEDFSAPIFKNLATKVFMPNAEPDAGYKDIIGLTEEEFEIVKRMEIGDRHFLFKHEDDAVIAEIDFSDSVELVKILSPDITTIAAMEEVINVNATPEQPNPDVETWLPQLFEILRAIENERVESEKKQALEAMREQRRRLKAKLEG